MTKFERRCARKEARRLNWWEDVSNGPSKMKQKANALKRERRVAASTRNYGHITEADQYSAYVLSMRHVRQS